jgi:signal transduction histidine kinase
MDTTPVSLPALVEGEIEAARGEAGQAGVTLEACLTTSLPAVTGDAGRLQQVIRNLLSNAIKFTPAGGHVRVRLDRVDDEVRLVVADTGVGIAREFLPHVFDRFRQADGSMTRAYGGLGVGLSIVRELVELHGGRVEVESLGAGTGATFTVRLPARPVAQPMIRLSRRRPEGVRREAS